MAERLVRLGSKRAVGALAAVALLAGACTAPIRNQAAPRCTKTDTLVLMAQSVPSAELLPCINAVPAGWAFGEMDIGTGDANFTLDSDEAGVEAVKVTLTARCDTVGSTEVASDEPPARQFERIESLVGQFRAVRAYVFEGGCVTYRFRFGDEGSALVNDVSLALAFTTRAHVADEVRRTSDGRLQL